MNDSIHCLESDQRRRHAARAAGLNGIDYVEPESRSELRVFFVGLVPALEPVNLRIDAPAGSAPLTVDYVEPCPAGHDRLDACLRVFLAGEGDPFGAYVL